MNFADKAILFSDVAEMLLKKQIRTAEVVDDKPWGGYFVINENDRTKFIQEFYPELEEALFAENRISPKILLVAPEKRLSWQYHFRRAESWKLIGGEAYVARSLDDEEQEKQALILQEKIELQQGERHRLIGGSCWGVVAEIWQHTDAEHPSDEADIVRVQDDFGR